MRHGYFSQNPIYFYLKGLISWLIALLVNICSLFDAGYFLQSMN